MNNTCGTLLRTGVFTLLATLAPCTGIRDFNLANANGLVSRMQLAALAPSSETEKQREARLIEGAKSEGKVVYWDSVNAKEWEYVFGKFRQRYPFVATEFWRAGDAEVYQKVITEARAGVHNFDLAGVEINLLSELKKTGLMKKYAWPSTAGWSPPHKDSEGYWVARQINCVVIAYNTNLVSAAEAPKTWEDLLNPKWKGAVSMDKDGSEWVLLLMSVWGKEKTLNYLTNLAKNNISLGGATTQRTEMLGAGAFKLDLRLNLDRILYYRQQGAPLDWVRTDPILTRPSPTYIAERAPHPNSAMLFADWFTSLEGQNAIHEASGKFLPDQRVKSKVGDALSGQKVAFFPVEFGVHGSEAERMWRDIFLK
jgi:iron(III) transport system substrate-binding protein